jgi:hypothetical protein
MHPGYLLESFVILKTKKYEIDQNLHNIFHIIFPHLLLYKIRRDCLFVDYTEAFYKTASDAEKGLIAVYGPIGDMGNGLRFTLVSDFSADQTYPRPVVGRNTLTLFTYDANYTVQKSNGRIFESPQQIWSSSYDGIEKSNWIIEKVPGATMDETVRSKS